MSIRANYRRVSQDTFKLLSRSAKYAREFFGDNLEYANDDDMDAWIEERDKDGRYLDIGVLWQALHFLLTGSVGSNSEKLSSTSFKVVEGGKDTKWDAVYGKVRYLTPAEVEEVCLYLSSIDEADLQGKYNSNEFMENDVYPGGEVWGENGVIVIINCFVQVRSFFCKANKEHDYVLLSLS